MRLAGIVIGFVGGWLIATVIVGTFVASGKVRDTTEMLPMVEGVALAAPWTGMIAAGIMLIVAANWLYERKS